MPRPRNPNRTDTTVAISKILEGRLRRHVIKSTKREGNEKLGETIERIFNVYEKTNPPIHTTPQSTYQ